MSVSELAAEKWGLPSSRTSTIGNAGDDPDHYEGGLDNGFNQQWSHAYLYSAFGFWIWGDANENFDDCITGSAGDECKDGESAADHYAAGNQQVGDTYLGYASHYVEDVSVVMHSSDPVPPAFYTCIEEDIDRVLDRLLFLRRGDRSLHRSLSQEAQHLASHSRRALSSPCSEGLNRSQSGTTRAEA